MHEHHKKLAKKEEKKSKQHEKKAANSKKSEKEKKKHEKSGKKSAGSEAAASSDEPVESGTGSGPTEEEETLEGRESVVGLKLKNEPRMNQPTLSSANSSSFKASSSSPQPVASTTLVRLLNANHHEDSLVARLIKAEEQLSNTTRLNPNQTQRANLTFANRSPEAASSTRYRIATDSNGDEASRRSDISTSDRASTQRQTGSNYQMNAGQRYV